jgi:hypothetical protein
MNKVPGSIPGISKKSGQSDWIKKSAVMQMRMFLYKKKNCPNGQFFTRTCIIKAFFFWIKKKGGLIIGV